MHSFGVRIKRQIGLVDEISQYFIVRPDNPPCVEKVEIRDSAVHLQDDLLEFP